MATTPTDTDTETTTTDINTMAQSTPYPDEFLTDEAHGDDAKADWIERRDSHEGIIHQREDDQWYRIEDNCAGPDDEAWIESKGLVSGEELKS